MFGIRGAALALILVAVTACGAADEEAGKVVVATHGSWSMSEEVLAEFEAESGYEVDVQPAGDAGVLTNKLVLTKGAPIADVAFGVDNTFASRAVDEGVFDGEITAIDFSDVCLNIDDAWFEAEGIAKPTTLGDLLKPRYRNLTVLPGAATSSVGMSFLLATIGEYGEGWTEYWRDLMANGAKLTSGWTDAYTVDFTAGGGDGNRPIVVSYSSSPPFTIPEGGSEPTTSALLDTCFRQTEYAGVLHGANNPEGARAFVEFMTGRTFQEALPDEMYVYPIDESAELPEIWTKFAPKSPDPITIPAEEITANRADWLRTWRDITSE